MNIYNLSLITSLISIQCLNEIVQHYNLQNDGINLMSDRGGFDFPVTNFRFHSKFRINEPIKTPRLYIFENIRGNKLKHTLMGLQASGYLFKPREKFLFIGNGFSKNDQMILRKMFISDVMYINQETGIVYANYSKRIGSCHGNTFNIQIDHPLKKDTTPQKKLRILTHCIPAYTPCENLKLLLPGLEYELFNFIFAHIGINMDWISDRRSYPKFASNFHKHTFDQDIFLGSKFLMVDWFDCTLPYAEDTMGWIVKRAQRVPRYRFLLLIFSRELWIFWITTFVTMASVYYLSSVLLLVERNDFCKTLLALIFGKTQLLKTTHLSRKLVRCCIDFFFFMMLACFGTRLTYLLNGIEYEKGINSQIDISSRKLNILVNEISMKDIVRGIPTFENYPDHLFKPSKTLELNMREVEKNPFIVNFVSVRQARSYLSTQNIHSIKELRDQPVRTKITARFVKGHPMFPLINKYIKYVVETGWMEKILENYNFAFTPEESGLEATQKLKMEHIYAPLAILSVGLTISLMIFLWEKYHMRQLRQFANKKLFVRVGNFKY